MNWFRKWKTTSNTQPESVKDVETTPLKDVILELYLEQGHMYSYSWTGVECSSPLEVGGVKKFYSWYFGRPQSEVYLISTSDGTSRSFRRRDIRSFCVRKVNHRG